MYEIIRVPASGVDELTADKLNIGDLAEVIGRGLDGTIVLKTSTGIVSLSAPQSTWQWGDSLKVKKLLPGTVLQLRVKA